MEVGQFISNIEQYYGKYSSQYKRKNVVAYLTEYVKENERAAFFKVVLFNVSDKYGRPPDIATLEEVKKGHALEILAEISGPKWEVIAEG